MHGCEAIYHSPNCPCLNCKKNCDNCHELTIDHFTPKCIAKVFNWNRKTTSSHSNTQMLSVPCHRIKDRSTPQRFQLALQQRRGRFIGLEEYREFRNENDLLLK